eukprot:1159872-Pelagomonas_calceolata.AAC.1
MHYHWLDLLMPQTAMQVIGPTRWECVASIGGEGGVARYYAGTSIGIACNIIIKKTSSLGTRLKTHSPVIRTNSPLGFHRAQHNAKVSLHHHLEH